MGLHNSRQNNPDNPLIKCDRCGGAVRVINTDQLLDHPAIYRRRKCVECDKRFNTVEVAKEHYEYLLDKKVMERDRT